MALPCAGGDDGRRPQDQEGLEGEADHRGRRRPPEAGVRLPRGAAARPVPPPRRLPLERPGRVRPRVPLAPAPRHRDDHVRPRRRRGARGQPREPRRHLVGGRAVDDGRQRHHPPGDAEGRPRGPDVGLPALGEPPRAPQDDGSRYREVKRDDIPEATTAEGATVRVVCGEVAGVRGPVREIVTEPDYLDVSIPARSTFRHPVKAGHTVFAYVFEGEGYFDPERDPYAREDVGERYFDMERPCVCGNGTVVLYGPGDTVAVSTEERPVRFLLVSGRPLGEPVAWYGPIVMNTQAELRVAFREYEQGTFVKHARR